MEETQDTEITLGTGKLLGIFFAVAALCALFFTMGYMLGRGAGGRVEAISQAPGGNPNPANKPAAANRPVEPAAKPDSTLYNSVASRMADAPATDARQPDSSSKNSASKDTAPAAGDSPASAPSGVPEMKNVAAGGPYMVQVAAVSKREDAEILVAALRKKQYPVFIVSNVPGDALFHVQVGPFTDAKEAESMRDKLSGDGYNAIMKK